MFMRLNQPTQMGAMLTQALQLANRQQVLWQLTQLLPLARLLALRRERQVQDKQTHRHQWMSTLVCAPGEQRVTFPPYLSSTNAGMTTRHAKIEVWTSNRKELISWLCLLDDRCATELAEAERSTVKILPATLDVGKAARSTKLWFLL